MKLQKYNPRSTLPSVFDNTGFDSMFSTLLDCFMEPNIVDERVSGPYVQTHTHDTEYLVSAELPGYDKKDIKVEILDNTLLITGSLESKEGNGSSATTFRKEFTLPKDVDIENINASLEKGILDILLPRKVKEARRIDIT